MRTTEAAKGTDGDGLSRDSGTSISRLWETPQDSFLPPSHLGTDLDSSRFFRHQVFRVLSDHAMVTR
jgi:hypothetical protein